MNVYNVDYNASGGVYILWGDWNDTHFIPDIDPNGANNTIYPLCDRYCVPGGTPTPIYLAYNFVMLVLLMPIIGIFGLVGNVLSIVVFTRPYNRSSANSYLAALACSDFLIVLTGLFLFPMDSLKRYSYNLEMFHGHGTPIFYTLGSTAQTASVFFTVAAAVDCLIRTVSRTNGCTVCTACAWVCWLAVASVAYNIVHVFEMELVTCYSPEYGLLSVTMCPTPFRMNADYILIYYSYMYTIFMAGGPLILLIVLNCVILTLTHVKKRKKSRSASIAKKASRPHKLSHPMTSNGRSSLEEPDNQEQADDPITLVLVVCLFIFCNSLALTINLMESILGDKMRAAGNYLVDVSNLLVVCNSSANFLIYLKYDPKFRIALKRVLQSCFAKSEFNSAEQHELNCVETDQYQLAVHNKVPYTNQSIPATNQHRDQSVRLTNQHQSSLVINIDKSLVSSNHDLNEPLNCLSGNEPDNSDTDYDNLNEELMQGQKASSMLDRNRFVNSDIRQSINQSIDESATKFPDSDCMHYRAYFDGEKKLYETVLL